MLTATCPSCSAPLRFAHAAAPVAVCPSCQSTVARAEDDLRLIGKVARFARDLSPIQVGSTGRHGDRAFEVVGVLRKGRARVRWNEWFLVFADGGVGWLGEGNAHLTLFGKPPTPQPEVPARVGPGQELRLGERRWVVLEAAEAAVLAAEGALPFAVSDQSALPYADLRSLDGRSFGTLDLGEDPPLLWEGQPVDLPGLHLEGLRPLSGWTEGVEGLQGPEVQAVRSLRCPSCSASLSLRAPGQSQRVVCEYCGSSLSVDERDGASTLGLVLQAQRAWKPPLALGSRGRLGGVDWELLGAMERFVRVEGQTYPWREYLLHNPYRGFRWLVESNGHWLFVAPLAQVPGGGGRRPGTLRLGDTTYRHFQGGTAEVRRVLGEFYWEVAVGDQAQTDDWVAPPRMISRETTGDEIHWSVGQYLPLAEVEAAFGKQEGRPEGIAPAQPNPYAGPGPMGRATLGAGLLLALNLGLALGSSLGARVETVLDAQWSSPGLAAQDVLLSEPFLLERADNLRVTLSSPLPRDQGQVHVALVNTGSGQVYLLGAPEATNAQTMWLNEVAPGPYVARVEVARDPALVGQPTTVHLQAELGPRFTLPLVLTALLSLLGPVMVFFARARFEGQRWAESDHAP